MDAEYEVKTFKPEKTEEEKRQAAFVQSATHRDASGIRAGIEAAEERRQAEADLIARVQREQAAARRRAEGAALMTPEGRAAAQRREAEDDNARIFAADAELSEDLAAQGLRSGDGILRMQATRDAIRSKAAQLLSQTADANGRR
ncbi:hypothetical protein [Microbacterium xylanilyticum]